MARNQLRTQRLWLAFALAAAAALSACEDIARRASTTAPAGSGGGDANYTSALAAADRFCVAWKNRDLPKARSFLTPGMVQRHRKDQLNDALAGSGNPEHSDFEILPGRKARLRQHYLAALVLPVARHCSPPCLLVAVVRAPPAPAAVEG